MAEAHAYQVIGDPRQAFNIAQQALTEAGFRVGPEDKPFEVEAERGSKGATVALGAFVGKKRQHVRVTLRAVTQDGVPVLHYIPSTSGVAAGAIGYARANDAYAEVAFLLAQRLQTDGVLASSTVPTN